MKKIIFWVLFPITSLVYILLALVEMLAHYGGEGLDAYEGWAFDLKKKGWKNLGSGCWSKHG